MPGFACALAWALLAAVADSQAHVDGDGAVPHPKSWLQHVAHGDFVVALFGCSWTQPARQGRSPFQLFRVLEDAMLKGRRLTKDSEAWRAEVEELIDHKLKRPLKPWVLRELVWALENDGEARPRWTMVLKKRMFST